MVRWWVSSTCLDIAYTCLYIYIYRYIYNYIIIYVYNSFMYLFIYLFIFCSQDFEVFPWSLWGTQLWRRGAAHCWEQMGQRDEVVGTMLVAPKWLYSMMQYHIWFIYIYIYMCVWMLYIGVCFFSGRFSCVFFPPRVLMRAVYSSQVMNSWSNEATTLRFHVSDLNESPS